MFLVLSRRTTDYHKVCLVVPVTPQENGSWPRAFYRAVNIHAYILRTKECPLVYRLHVDGFMDTVVSIYNPIPKVAVGKHRVVGIWTYHVGHLFRTRRKPNDTRVCADCHVGVHRQTLYVKGGRRQPFIFIFSCSFYSYY
jgi:hypothetical protein